MKPHSVYLLLPPPTCLLKSLMFSKERRSTHLSLEIVACSTTHKFCCVRIASDYYLDYPRSPHTAQLRDPCAYTRSTLPQKTPYLLPAFYLLPSPKSTVLTGCSKSYMSNSLGHTPKNCSSIITWHMTRTTSKALSPYIHLSYRSERFLAYRT